MKQLFFILIFILLSVNAAAQSTDTVDIQKQHLEFKYLIPGNSTYIIYHKKTESSPAERITLVNIKVEPTVIDGKSAYAITQQWDESDNIAHKSYTAHDAKDFSTLKHETWWKRRDVTMKFDFITKQAIFEGTIDETIKSKVIDDFNHSFEKYNLCWHSDLTIFPLLPYKNGRTFRVNFYDPGASKSTVAEYVVKGSEQLTASNGEKIDCWVMEHQFSSNNSKGYQRFWISKKTREVLKEMDEYSAGFRYKMKIGISGEK